MQHPRRHDGAGDAGVAVAEADLLQSLAEAEVLQGLQADALAADRARVLVLEAVEVDLRRPRRRLRLLQAARAQLAGDGLRRCVQFGVRLQQAHLAGHLHLRQMAELAPALPGHGESGAEVGQGDLADLPADSLGFDEAVAAGGLPALHVGFRGFDAHAANLGGKDSEADAVREFPVPGIRIIPA